MKAPLLTLAACAFLVACTPSGNEGRNEGRNEGGAWRYSEHVDKLTGNTFYTAEARLSDKEVPLVLTDVILKCDPKQPGSAISPKGRISIDFTTLKSTPDGGQFSGMPMVMKDQMVQLAVRTDTDEPRIFYGSGKQYNNSISVALKDAGELDEIKENPALAALLGLGFDIFISPSTLKEIVVRIPTQQGEPTVVIPLQNSSIKKVASQCGWNLAQQVTATSSSADKQIVGRWFTELSEPVSEEKSRGEITAVEVEEFFANGSARSEAHVRATLNFDAGVSNFQKMEFSYDQKIFSEWQIKDGSLVQKYVIANFVPGYMQIDGVQVNDEAKKAELFEPWVSAHKEQYAKGKIDESKIISIDKDKFVREDKGDDGKVTRTSATRTDKTCQPIKSPNYGTCSK